MAISSWMWHQGTDNKRKNRQIEFHESFWKCHQQTLSTEQKGSSTEWEKFANHRSVKGLIFRMYRKFLKLNNKQFNSKMIKWLEQPFLKILRWSTHSWKDYHHYSLEKCKSKLRWDNIAYSLEWLLSRNQTNKQKQKIASIRQGIKKLEYCALLVGI